jgi:hypothetical protein
MKNNAWKKNYLVIMHSDYDNTWTVKTIPCTLLQAIRFVNSKRWDHLIIKYTVRIVTLAEFETIKTLEKA